MSLTDVIYKGMLRLKYPVSTLDDVMDSLGVDMPQTLFFKKFIGYFSQDPVRSPSLHRFMPRQKAEANFYKAIKKDSFRYDTVFTFCFPAGCLEVHLSYDEQARLRRAFLDHRLIEKPIEIKLNPL